MNIVVCIKQVPDTDDIKIDPETNTLIREGVESIINPYDLHALETALSLKDRLGGTVTVISMGPGQVKKSLKKTIALGADHTVLLSDRSFAGADTLATSYTLACGIKELPESDLIICGKQAIDGDTAQVGPGIAEHLQIPHITYVKEIMEANEHQLTVKRETETGYDVIKMELPGVITTLMEINEPRLPSIRGILRSRKTEIPVWGIDDITIQKEFIGLDGSPTQVVKVDTPDLQAEGEIYEGEPENQVEQLIKELNDRQIL